MPLDIVAAVASDRVTVNRPRLLLVDDAPPYLAALAGVLSEYDCHLASDGVEALAYLERVDVLPDLILLDVILPHEDGFEICRQLRAKPRFADIPVIFMTGLSDAESETKGLSVGGVDYIAKPFNAHVVRARVRTHLALTSARNKLAQANGMLEQQVAQRTAQLAEALKTLSESSLETVFCLSRAAEYRDEDSGRHVKRVSYYAAAIARQLGLADDPVKLLLHAAAMHDVGKIGIPDRILLKRGRLSADEWEVMKQHTVIGAKILSASEADVMKLARACALTHHERWDGTGYPAGLSGRDIPLPGRILAVADMFDALVSKRAYKSALSIDVAFDLVESDRELALDPAVVDAFFAVRSEILRVKADYADPANDPLKNAVHDPARQPVRRKVRRYPAQSLA
jgi:putative two-component system response regulator